MYDNVISAIILFFCIFSVGPINVLAPEEPVCFPPRCIKLAIIDKEVMDPYEIIHHFGELHRQMQIE
ncbi:hypothetical protein VNO78_32132 [Psophocarpus tetragonolobus]|uniref:Uncharacterized protein n=1 Tax=Psophocarpus tetragonolobus TaxID=3891 RepID=A0AAN9RYY0_PSOTE